MKSKEEIEQLAELWNDQQTELEFGKPHNAPNRVKSFVQGYTQCQEDMADKKYTEEDMKRCWNSCLDFNKPAGLDNGINYRDFINSINDGQD